MVDSIERNKDLIQELVESTATHVGQIATIVTGAVADIAREIGDLFTDGFEMRDAARQARADEERGLVDADAAESLDDLEIPDLDAPDTEAADADADVEAEAGVDAEVEDLADTGPEELPAAPEHPALPAAEVIDVEVDEA